MRSIASFALGLGIPVLSIVLYLGSQGALSDMVDAVFVFNSSYVSGSGTDLLQGFQTGLYAFPFAGFWIIGGLAAALAHLLEPALQSPRRRFLVIVLIALLAEFVFSNLSGLGYKHYYLTWLPFAGFLAAYFAYSLMRLLGTCLPAWKPGPNSLYGTLLLVLAPIFMGMAAHLASQYFPLGWMTSAPVWDTPAHPMNRLRPYLLREHGLLMWGNEVAHNFMLDVEAPTRFAYQVPLLQPAFSSEPMLRDFISDLSADLPVIVDTSGTGSFIIPLEPVRRAAFFSRPENAARYQYLEPLFEFIDTNYQPPVPASGTWVIFLPRQASPLH